MKSFITVIGEDQVGIIAGLSAILAESGVNILDINQTVMDSMFTMIMMVDTSSVADNFAGLSDGLKAFGENKGLSVRIQREEIFRSMHRI